MKMAKILTSYGDLEEEEEDRCIICGRKLVREGVNNALVCPIHSTRGVPRDLRP